MLDIKRIMDIPKKSQFNMQPELHVERTPDWAWG
jgi:hypothetical protein